MGNKQSAIIIGILLLIIGLLFGYSLSLWGNSMMSSFAFGNMMGRSMAVNMDRRFIEQMIPHHEGAIAMAQVVLEKSSRSEIRYLATGIIEAQQREINEMRVWYQEWFGSQVPATSQNMMGGYSMGHMGSMSGDIEILRSAEDFDREFIRQMIPHHEMAIMMAEMLQNSTNRPEMRRLADDIITSQAREIELMKSWGNG